MDEPRLPWGGPVPAGLAARYTLGAVLGHGAMGAAQRAIQRSLDRPVVLKLMATGAVVDPVGLVRFESEARILARLDHPHVLPVVDFGCEPGVAYIAYPDLGGRSLEDHLAKDPPPGLDEALRWLDQILDGLSHVHEQGVVHRDIKPANLLLTAEGSIRIFDFGLARDLLADQGLTATGMIVGTPLYLAPEQIRAEPPDPRDDLYAVGVLAYRLLAGENPFAARGVDEILDRHLAHDPIPVHTRAPVVPIPISLLVQELMAKSRAHRPASAGATRARLGLAAAPARPRSKASVLAPGRVEPGAETPSRARPGPEGRPGPRRPILPVLGALATLALALGMSLPPAPAPSSPFPIPAPAPAEPSHPSFSVFEAELRPLLEPDPILGFPALADPATWSSIDGRRPALRSWIRALAAGTWSASATPDDLDGVARLEQLALDAGVPFPLATSLRLEPYQGRVALESSDGASPAGLGALPTVTGWLARAVATSRQARACQARAETELAAALASGSAGVLPAAVFEALRTRVLGKQMLAAGPGVGFDLDHAVKAYRDGGAIRAGFSRWLAPGHQALHEALAAVARSLRGEPETAEAAGVLGAHWVDELGPLALAPWSHLPPAAVLGGPVPGPAGALLLGLVSERSRRVRTLAEDAGGPTWSVVEDHLVAALAPPGPDPWSAMRFMTALDQLLDVAQAGKEAVDLPRIASLRAAAAAGLSRSDRSRSAARILETIDRLHLGRDATLGPLRREMFDDQVGGLVGELATAGTTGGR